MEDLTFGEQVKIILSRKGMTIKELAELIEARTGKKMSRQNLTQRLGRDNFQEQDMRMIAAILGCPFQLSIFPMENAAGEKMDSMEELLLKYVKNPRVAPKRKKADMEDGVYQQVLVFDQDSEPEKTPEMPAKAEKPEEAREKPEETREKPVEAKKTEETREKPVEAEEPLEAAQDEETAESSPTATKKLPNITAAMLAVAQKPDVQENAGDGDMEELLELDVLDAEDSEDLEEPEIPVQETGGTDSEGSDFAIAAAEKKAEKSAVEEREMTIGELYDIHKELSELADVVFPEKETKTSAPAVPVQSKAPAQKAKREEGASVPDDFEPVIRYEDAAENLELGEMNPYTGREYQTNSVRMHPTRLGYVQVYDRLQHGWTDMTEWAFLGYQERKKALLGRDYEPPIYLD